MVALGNTLGNGETMSLVQDKGGVLLAQLKAASGVTSGTLMQVVDGSGNVNVLFNADGTISSAKPFTYTGTYGTQTFSGALAGQQQPIVASGAASVTLTAAQSGSLFLMDAASGITYTLPVATTGNKGIWFDFLVTVTCTSNGHKVITGAGTELLIGGVTDVDTDTSNAVAFFTGDGSTHISVNMTAAGTNAKGGIIGSKLRFTNISTTRWVVEGMVMAAGTPTTPFSNS